MGSIVKHESCKSALSDFAQAHLQRSDVLISSEVESIIEEISKSGVSYYPWIDLRELYEAKLTAVVNGYNTSFGYEEQGDMLTFEKRREVLVSSLRNFDEAPFTLQRLSEVLLEPERQYTVTHKLLNSLDKILSVSSVLPSRDRPFQDSESVVGNSSSIDNTPSSDLEGKFNSGMECSPRASSAKFEIDLTHEEQNEVSSNTEDNEDSSVGTLESVDMQIDGF